MTWTFELQFARWFAGRYTRGEIWRATVPPEAVLAVLGSHQTEVIVDPAFLGQDPWPLERVKGGDRGACELCAAVRLTEWFHEDEQCWVAECRVCAVPMVVWKVHDPTPSPDVTASLHARLADVATQLSLGGFWIDDNLRSIPGHYHAHARRGRRRNGVG